MVQSLQMQMKYIQTTVFAPSFNIVYWRQKKFSQPGVNPNLSPVAQTSRGNKLSLSEPNIPASQTVCLAFFHFSLPIRQGDFETEWITQDYHFSLPNHLLRLQSREEHRVHRMEMTLIVRDADVKQFHWMRPLLLHCSASESFSVTTENRKMTLLLCLHLQMTHSKVVCSQQ